MKHLKEERLKSVMGRGWISKNMEGNLSCIINPKEEYRGPDGARRAIGDALGILQSIRDAGDEFYEAVNSEDLGDIITFLSNKYWYLNRVKDNKKEE